MKTCKSCLNKYPENRKYFHKQNGGKKGLRGSCKECVNKRQRYYNRKEEYKEKNRKYVRKRRSKKLKLKNTLTNKDWMYTLDCFNHSCVYCNMTNKESILKFKENLSRDHILALNKRGDYEMGNVIPACKSCNSSKGDNEMVEWYKKQYFFRNRNLNKILLFIEKYKEDINKSA